MPPRVAPDSCGVGLISSECNIIPSRASSAASSAKRMNIRLPMSQTISPLLERDELVELTRRGISTPAQLSTSEIARLCTVLLRKLNEADDLILRSRWGDPSTLLDP